jgi:hypothetical protein
VKNRTIAILVAAAALLSIAKGELFGPRAGDGVRPYGVGLALSDERGDMTIEIGGGDCRLVVRITREVVGSLTRDARGALLASIDPADNGGRSAE